jgi:H/ACA ribonucleoprotein complex subunit 4
MVRSAPGERSPAELLAFGVVNCDKPAGPSAHQVSAWVRDEVDERLAAATDGGLDRAAHAGTLDPKVTGCLPVLLGDATRLAQVFLEGSKEYVAVLECHGPVPDDVEAVAAEFEGEVYQKPPRKSAVSRRLRSREIHALDVLEHTDRQVLLRIRCESGTYVRKLCHDLGLALGTGGHMGHLRRTGTAPFDDRDLATLHDLWDALAEWAEHDDETWLREVVAPAERTLEHLPQVTVARSAAEQVAEGAPLYAPGVEDYDHAAADAGADDLVACVAPNGSVVCLGHVVGDLDADAGLAVALERVLV